MPYSTNRSSNCARYAVRAQKIECRYEAAGVSGIRHQAVLDRW